VRLPPNAVDDPRLRERRHVFGDRVDAGAALARLLERHRDRDAVVLAIPAGGAAVGRAVAAALGLPLDVAVVSKITLPWDTEAGYGAVAFDGTVRLNRPLIDRLGLRDDQIAEGLARTRARVEGRVRALRGDRPMPRLAGRPCLVVDDGLASGFTMRVAVAALRAAGATEIVVAVPTGHLDSVVQLAGEVAEVACSNVRSGLRFAVAEAYEQWRDVDDAELVDLLRAGD